MAKQHYSLGLNGLKAGVRMWVPKEDTGKKHGYIVWEWWGHYLNPMTYWRWARNFCLRGWYGYAPIDYWDADGYLESVMLGVIRDLRAKTHGYPSSMARYGPWDVHSLETGENDTDPPEDGFERWMACLNEIIEGLEAAAELRYEDTVPDGVYSEGPWHFEQCEDNPTLSTLVDESKHKFNQELYDEWQAPLLKKRKRAMLLLCKHWGSFWD